MTRNVMAKLRELALKCCEACSDTYDRRIRQVSTVPFHTTPGTHVSVTQDEIRAVVLQVWPHGFSRHFHEYNKWKYK